MSLVSSSNASGLPPCSFILSINTSRSGNANAGPAVPPKTLSEFLDRLEGNPNTYNYTFKRVKIEWFKEQTKIIEKEKIMNERKILEKSKKMDERNLPALG